MAEIGADNTIYNLRTKIQQIQEDLRQLGMPVSEIPELINLTNVLRLNEYLIRTNDKKTELVFAYEQYSKALEDILSSVFAIQRDFKEILKDQSSLLSASAKRQAKIKAKRIPKK